MMNQMKDDTGLLYAGDELDGDVLHADAPPIFLASAYAMGDLHELVETVDADGYVYNRIANPDRNALGKAISYLENGQKTFVCSSGMAAINLALHTCTKQGDHILANSSLYGETIDLMDNILPRYGIETSYANFTNPDEIRKAIRPNTKVLYTEVISNPLTTLVDLDEVAAVAHGARAVLMVDSTFTTPFVIKPLEHGADLVMHSLTKYFGGHSDLTAGSITYNDPEIGAELRNQYILTSCCADPVSSWLCLRSVRTMGLRVRKQIENAELLSRALLKNPHVRRVNHPSLDTHPQRELAKRMFPHGCGAMLSFSVADDREKINEFLHRLQFVKYLTTLGGLRTSMSHPVSSSHYGVPEEIRLKMGIHEGLLRVSVGTEDIDDLISEFNSALDVFT